MQTEQYIINFYSNYDEDGRLASRHGAVEFLTTMRYIEKYAGPGARVLEVGAGTGRYSHALARRGYAVDAVELVAHNIEVFRRNTQPGEAVTINVAEYVKNGLLDAETFAASSEPKDLFELVRKEDVDELMAAFPTTRLHYVAADGCALLLRGELDAMEESTFQLYLRYHFATCERADLLGVTSHALDIFRK